MPSPPSRPHGDASLLEGAPDRARSYLQLLGDPLGGPSLGVNLGCPMDLIGVERSAIPLRDAVAPYVAEDRGPVHLERLRQHRHWDTVEVGGDQLGHLAWRKAPLNRERGDQGIGRVNGILAEAGPQHRPERRQPEQMASHLRKRAAPGRRRWSCTVTR